MVTRLVPRRDERGAGSVLGLLVSAVLVVVALTAAGLTSVILTHRVAQAGADLAALAAATAAQDGRDPCTAAARVATANRTELRQCLVSGFEVTVGVTARTGRLPGGPHDLPARARAGPVASLG
ncbi:hypothetical protein GCM10028771_00740 [Nocardioides marmoraquaticus]